MVGLTDWLHGYTIPHLCTVETKPETGKDSGKSEDSTALNTELVVKNVSLLSSHTHNPTYTSYRVSLATEKIHKM